MTEHLSAEALAALVDGALAPGDRAKTMEHLAGCEACFEIYAESLRIVEPRSMVRRFPARRWLAVAAVVLVALGITAVWRLQTSAPPDGVRVAESLAAALAPGDLEPGPPGRLGFASSDPSPAQAAFRVGAARVRVAVATRRGWLDELGGLRARVAELEARLATVSVDAAPPTQLERYAALGVWCEEVRLALRAGLDLGEVVTLEAPRTTGLRLGPPGLEGDLETLEAALRAGDRRGAERRVLSIMSLL